MIADMAFRDDNLQPTTERADSRHPLDQSLLLTIRDHPPILALPQYLHFSHLLLELLQSSFPLRREVEPGIIVQRIEQGRVGEGRGRRGARGVGETSAGAGIGNRKTSGHTS
jgi:hypothetical protein